MAGGGQKTRTGPRLPEEEAKEEEEEEVERLTGDGVEEGGGQEVAGETDRMAGLKGDSRRGCGSCGC
jgi:hypothetical protein